MNKESECQIEPNYEMLYEDAMKMINEQSDLLEAYRKVLTNIIMTAKNRAMI